MSGKRGGDAPPAGTHPSDARPPEALRADLWTIYRAGLAASEPAAILEGGLGGSAAAGWRFRGEPLLPPAEPGEGPLLVVGAGKAAAALAAAVLERLPGESVAGRIIVKRGHRRSAPGVVVEEAGHPTPDADSEAATRRLLADLRRAGSRSGSRSGNRSGSSGGRVLLLLTGGASALLAAPAEGITLEEKSRVTDLLLRSGADIHRMNAVRKHLSAVKGGQLLPLLPPGRTGALLISDVVGDRLTSIGSGPATPDPTTFAEAAAVLRDFDLWARVPESVRRRFEQGAAGRLPETPKSAPEAPPHHLLASNRRALDAAAARARELGYRVEVFGRDLTGDLHAAARRFARRLVELRGEGRRTALLGGGELTLRVRGDGSGGRCQEFALVAAAALEGVAGAALLVAGTDGTDGPTDAAGAFADGGSGSRARAAGFDPAGTLARNDSGSLFRATGDLAVTGPTGTNVMDLLLGVTAGGPA